VTFLNLFPISKRFERIPGAIAFAGTAAMVVFYFKERSALAVGLVIASAVLLVLVYIIRFRQRKEWETFFTEENKRLMKVRGERDPERYIQEEKKILAGIRHPDLKIAVKLNLGTVLLANADPSGALEILKDIVPGDLEEPSLLLVYWTRFLDAAIQMDDETLAAQAYEAATALLPELHEALQRSFLPMDIQYSLFLGEYEAALEAIGDIPTKELDASGRDLLTVLRICALRGVGAEEKAEKLTREVQGHDLLPSTRLWLERAKSIS